MAQFLTFLTFAGIAVAFWWFVTRRILQADNLKVFIRLDRSAPGAHLIWDIVNAGSTPITVTRLIIHDRSGGADVVPPELPRVLAPQDRLLVPTDVDWTLLGARSIAAGDANDGEHLASGRQLARIQEQLRELIDRRASTVSARDWLYGATDLAFGVVILGLGFFMLMWMIATG